MFNILHITKICSVVIKVDARCLTETQEIFEHRTNFNIIIRVFMKWCTI